MSSWDDNNKPFLPQKYLVNNIRGVHNISYLEQVKELNDMLPPKKNPPQNSRTKNTEHTK